MTVFVLLVEPAFEGYVLPALSATAPVTDAEAARLYRAFVRDTALAVARSGGDLLVAYRPDDQVPAESARGRDAEAAVRETVEAVESIADARFEVQVGSTRSARAGNAVTHLLEREDETSAAVLPGTAPLLARTDLDAAAMRLRSNEVVLGPGTDGRVYLAGFAAPVDFEGAFAPPALGSLARRAVTAGHGVSFLSQLTPVETGVDLRSVVAAVDARRTADRPVPPHTTAVVDDLGLTVAASDGGVALSRTTDA